MPIEVNDDVAENALRAQFHEMVVGVTARSDVFELIQTKRRRQRRTRVAGASATVLLAIVVAVSLSLGLAPSSPHKVSASGSPHHNPSSYGSTPRGTLIRLDALTIRLPSGYRVVKSATAYCDLGAVGYSWPAPTAQGMKTTASPEPQYPAIQTAATADGGCVSMLLTPPGSVGSAGLPGLINPSTESALQVGPYSGIVGTPQYTLGTPPAGSSEIVLEVQIPSTAGQAQELVVATAGLTQDQLVSIVSQGLR
jgi:hypothetical protein